MYEADKRAPLIRLKSANSKFAKVTHKHRHTHVGIQCKGSESGACINKRRQRNDGDDGSQRLRLERVFGAAAAATADTAADNA